MRKTIRSYSDLLEIPTFEERFEYAKLGGIVGEETFGSKRYLNQLLYHSPDWRHTRRDVIVRDNGYDLAHPEHPIRAAIYVHHLNPITVQDILDRNDIVFDPEYLVSVSLDTHNAMHYGDSELLPKPYIERTPNDTCPWRRR